MKHLKQKLKAIWLILKADGFDVAVTIPIKYGYSFISMSVFGKDNRANELHCKIDSCFKKIMKE